MLKPVASYVVGFDLLCWQTDGNRNKSMAPWSSHKYERLGDPSPSVDGQARYQLLGVFRLFFAAVAIAVISSSLTVLTWRTVNTAPTCNLQDKYSTTSILHTADSSLQAAQIPPHQNCGDSIEEALARGCSFDPLTAAWIPPNCPRDMTTEFIEAGGASKDKKWRYWADKEGEHEFQGFEELSHNGTGARYWTTQREHLNHCLYMLLRVHRLMQRARHGDGRVDWKSESFSHFTHCATMLYNTSIAHDQKLDDIRASGQIAFGYGSCWV